jgi:hypothetical protein
VLEDGLAQLVVGGDVQAGHLHDERGVEVELGADRAQLGVGEPSADLAHGYGLVVGVEHVEVQGAEGAGARALTGVVAADQARVGLGALDLEPVVPSACRGGRARRVLGDQALQVVGVDHGPQGLAGGAVQHHCGDDRPSHERLARSTRTSASVLELPAPHVPNADLQQVEGVEGGRHLLGPPVSPRLLGVTLVGERPRGQPVLVVHGDLARRARR